MAADPFADMSVVGVRANSAARSRELTAGRARRALLVWSLAPLAAGAPAKAVVVQVCGARGAGEDRCRRGLFQCVPNRR